MKHTAMAALRTYVEPAFRRPDYVQAAALCTRKGDAGLEVLLISNPSRKRWILPKGWPMRGKTLAEAALTEAWEEAGVLGTVAPDSIGEYRYRKEIKGGIPITSRCEVFHVAVTGMAEDFPEKGRRAVEWVTPAEALRRVTEPELLTLLDDVLPEMA